MTEHASNHVTTPLEAMVELQRTTLEASREMLSRSLSVQRETTEQVQRGLRAQEALQQQTLALSWHAVTLPMTEVERETTEDERADTSASRGRSVTHRTVDVAGEGNAVEVVDEQRTTAGRASRTPREGGPDVAPERSESSTDATSGAVTDTTGMRERTEPSTELVDDAAPSSTTSADEDVE